jgi:hypothetical protein
MGTHAAGFYVTWSGECAEADTPTSADAYLMSNQPWQLGGAGWFGPLGAGAFASLSGLSLPTCGRGGMREARSGGAVAAFHGFIRDGVGATHTAHTYGGTQEWEIDGVALANGADTILPNKRWPVTGIALAPPGVTCLNLGGAALAALGGAVQDFDGYVVVRYAGISPRYGRSCFEDFVSIPPDSIIGAPQALARLRAQIAQGGASFSVGTQTDGKERVLQSCQFAGLDPAGVVWVRPEDIGNQVEQIPPLVGSNTAQHFRFFPNAFLRRVSYVDGLGLAVVDDLPITEQPPVGPGGGSQPYRILQVDAAPENSTWVLIIDGQAVCVRLTHPSGSDYRRPDEIWNAVIVPAIQNVQGPASALPYKSPVLFSPLVPEQRGFLDKMRYLQYARMLSVNGADGEITTTDIPQWEIGPS